MDSRPAPPQPVSLREIASVFFWIGITSFGGGLVSWVYREAVEKRKWLKDHEFLSGFALCRILPGGNVINFSVYLGIHLRGVSGAVAGLTSLVVPPAVVGVALYELYLNFSSMGPAQFVLDGVAMTAAGLNIATAVKALRRSRNALAAATSIFVFVAVGILHWPMLWVVFGVAPVSLALAWRNPNYG
jgi:chromate transporter